LQALVPVVRNSCYLPKTAKTASWVKNNHPQGSVKPRQAAASRGSQMPEILVALYAAGNGESISGTPPKHLQLRPDM
jgi:hypothetical protein